MLSPLTRLNDPRESRCRQIIPVTSSNSWEVAPRSVTDDERREAEKALEDRRLNVRVGCFTLDSSVGEPGTAERADARGYARPAMWTHYADRHSGVCLVLERAALEAQATERFGNRFHPIMVAYAAGFDDALADAELVNFDQLDYQAHFGTAVLATLRGKNDDWAAEREYRVAVIDHDRRASCILPIATSLKGLVLGVDFRSADLPLAEAICAEFDLGDHVGQVSLNNAALYVIPARASDGQLTQWNEDEIRTGRMFEA